MHTNDKNVFDKLPDTADQLDMMDAEIKQEIREEEKEIREWRNRLARLQSADAQDSAIDPAQHRTNIGEKILQILQTIKEDIEPAGFYLNELFITVKTQLEKLDAELAEMVKALRETDSEAKRQELLTAICNKSVDILSELEYLNEKALAEKDYCLAWRHALEKIIALASPTALPADLIDLEKLVREGEYLEFKTPVEEMLTEIAKQRGKVADAKAIVDKELNRYSKNPSLLFNKNRFIVSEPVVTNTNDQHHAIQLRASK